KHRKAFADPFRLTAQAGFSHHSPVTPVTNRPDEVSASAYLSQQADITCETVSAGLGLRLERSHFARKSSRKRDPLPAPSLSNRRRRGAGRARSHVARAHPAWRGRRTAGA